jgi:hypothetical protein
VGQKGSKPIEPGWLAQAGRPTPFLLQFGLPFELEFPQSINSTSTASTIVASIHHTPKEDDGRRESSTLPRRCLRLDHSRHGWPCVVKPWWSSGAMPWVHQGICTFDGYINLILSLLLIYYDACLLSFICVASI